MKNYFRVQQKGYTFDQMKNFNSIDGGSKFGGAWEAMNDDDDLVILNGRVICRIYDGYRIIPAAEVARFKISEWKIMLADGSAYDYEN